MRFLICSSLLLSVFATIRSASLFNCYNPGNTCGSFGTCNYLTGQCTCVNGYEGERCQVLSANRCSTLTCNGNGLCVMVSGAATCSCNAGFSGASCEVEPMSCQCSSNSMTVRMTPPGDFSRGIGYVNGKREVATCQTARATASNEHLIIMPFDSVSCGSLTRTNLPNGEYMYSRMFRYRYDSRVLTNSGIDFTCNCIFGTTNGVVYSTFGVNGNDFNNLIQEQASGYIRPISYSMTTAGGVVVTRTTALVVGQPITLTVTADTGYCVMVDRIVVNNTLTNSNFREYTLVDQRCRTDLGKYVFTSEVNHNTDSSQLTIVMNAFLLDFSNSISIAVYYRAEPTGGCTLPSCPGRKKRQADGDVTPSSTESTGTILQVITINMPESSQITKHEQECDLSKNVMIGLIVMAVIIGVLLIVCFVIGLRMIIGRKRSTVDPPAYK